MSTAVTMTSFGGYHFRISSRLAQSFTIQKSFDLKHWSSLLTTNSATGLFDFTDTSSPPDLTRYYRALVLP
jgi:hypothetical protein